MRPAIVLGDDFHVFVSVASVQLIFDAEVGKMHGVIEVRKLVVACPVFDLARVAIRASVTVWPTSVPLLEPLLVLALELVVEDHAADVGALVAEPLLFSHVRAIELRIMREFARPVHACIEGLPPLTVAVAAMRLQQVVAPFRQGDGALAAVDRDEPRETFVPEMAEIAVSRVRGLIPRVAEIALGHHAKSPYGRERSALVAIEFVPVIAVDHDLAFESPWQIKIAHEDIARIVVPFTGIAIASPDLLVAVTQLVLPWIGIASELNPVDVDVAPIVIAVPRITPSRIVVPRHHGLSFSAGEWPAALCVRLIGSGAMDARGCSGDVMLGSWDRSVRGVVYEGTNGSGPLGAPNPGPLRRRKDAKKQPTIELL
jgi:hypothetical protein